MVQQMLIKSMIFSRDFPVCLMVKSLPFSAGDTGLIYSQAIRSTCPTVQHNQKRNSVSSVTQLCLTLCDPTDCSTSGFPVHHQLPESTQTHVHRVSDLTIPPSNHLILCHALSSCLQSFLASGSFPMSHFFESFLKKKKKIVWWFLQKLKMDLPLSDRTRCYDLHFFHVEF